MNAPGVAGYGAWDSPVTTDVMVAGGVRFGGLAAEGAHCYWVEGRAAEGGRNVLVRRDADGQHRDLTPAPFNVRTRVHEYGGGAFAIHEGTAWFVNFDDQCIYRVGEGAEPVAVTLPGSLRYANLTVDPGRGRLICVVEDHSREGEPENYLASIDATSGALQRLAAGHDFYSSPVLSADGRWMAWLTWDHPRMPWDGTELWLAEIEAEGGLGETVKIAGGDTVSVFQPTFAPNGELFFVADPEGWWNLYACGVRRVPEAVRAVHTGARELGRPQWAFGMRCYGFQGERILATFCEQGRWQLGWIDPRTGTLEPLQTDFAEIDAFAFAGDDVYILGGGPDRPVSLARLDLESGEACTFRVSSSVTLAPEWLSVAEPVTYPTSEGDVAHGYFYAPRNPLWQAPVEERPPLIVIGHGGPTGATATTFNPAIQYWTTRGFAVLDVNYRGSTGYGREYRDRLKGQWGVYDVADCVHGARALVERGLVDGARLAVRGGSAGGYTALAALVFHDTFTAGASYYGISELEALARDTHKFESRYLDQLIGPYPKERARYQERSPINHTDRLSCPVIFFQGLEDKVVPPNQAEMMVEALKAKGLPVAYLPFEGEQHGFRAAATIKRTLEAELYFYGRIFGFTPADEIEPVVIEGMSPP